jgi:WD40 repeat protein
MIGNCCNNRNGINKGYFDRYIPYRDGISDPPYRYNVNKNGFGFQKMNNDIDEKTSFYNTILKKHLLGINDNRILRFSNINKKKYKGNIKTSDILKFGESFGITDIYKTDVNLEFDRVLDAPDMISNYYLNLIDCNNNNIICLALYDTVYLYNIESSEIQELTDIFNIYSEDDIYVSSVKFSDDSENYLAIGTSIGTIQIWDISNNKQCREIKCSDSRISSLIWNNSILSGGDKNGYIYNLDVSNPNPYVSNFFNHDGEVCKLIWSPNNNKLASGSNDNNILIYDKYLISNNLQVEPSYKLIGHNSATKAIVWDCNNKLISGGGIQDGTIKFWDVNNEKVTDCINVKSQITSLSLSKYENIFISTQGYSDNNIILWNKKTHKKIKSTKAHTQFIMSGLLTKDERYLLSTSSDETLSFWNFRRTNKNINKHRNLSKLTVQFR